MKLELKTLLDQATRSIVRTTLDLNGARKIHITGHLVDMGDGLFQVENHLTGFGVRFHMDSIQSVQIGRNTVQIQLRRAIK